MYPFLIRTFHYFSLFTTLPVALVDIKMLTRRTVNVKGLIENNVFGLHPIQPSLT